jgi:hypothetical protein
VIGINLSTFPFFDSYLRRGLFFKSRARIINGNSGFPPRRIWQRPL